MMMVVQTAGDEQRASVEKAAFLPPHVRRWRERLGEALVRTGGEEDARSPGFAFVHYRRVFELFDEGFFASARSLVSSEAGAGEGRTGSLHSSFEALSRSRTCS